MIMKNKRAYLIKFYLLLFASSGFSQPGYVDPLPSWNAGTLKGNIIEFVAASITAGSPKFIPVDDRIAVFDNDGTLWPEQPVIQGLYAIAHLKEMVAADPSLMENPTVKAVFERDKEYFAEDGERKVAEIIMLTHANISEDDFDFSVKNFFNHAVYPKLDKPVTQLAYQPMVELLNYLRANNFKTYICSGGTVEFMRAVTPEMYNIPEQQVIGTSFKYKFVDDGYTNHILREPELNSLNDKEMKPVNIQLVVGKRPVFVGGNVRSGGDIAMMKFSKSNTLPSFQLLINHDDADREFAYQEPDNYSLNAAEQYNFNVVSMKNDWKKIFSFDK